VLNKAHRELLEAILGAEETVRMHFRLNWGGKRAIFVAVAMVDYAAGM
jgi:hypothetical protein